MEQYNENYMIRRLIDNLKNGSFDDPNIFNYYYGSLQEYWELLKAKISSNKIPMREKFDPPSDFLFRLTIDDYYDRRLFKRSKKYKVPARQIYQNSQDFYNNNKYSESNMEDIVEKLYPLNDEERLVIFFYPDQDFELRSFFPENYDIWLSESFLSKLGSILPGKNLLFIQKYFDTYEDYFYRLMSLLKNNFERLGSIKITDFIFVYDYVYFLFCGYPNSMSLRRDLSIDDNFQLCIIPNYDYNFRGYIQLFTHNIFPLIYSLPKFLSVNCPLEYPINEISPRLSTSPNIVESMRSIKKIFYKIKNSNIKNFLYYTLWVQIFMINEFPYYENLQGTEPYFQTLKEISKSLPEIPGDYFTEHNINDFELVPCIFSKINLNDFTPEELSILYGHYFILFNFV